MNRKEIAGAALATADGAVHTPVEVQKMFFLIDENTAEAVGGPHFTFEPCHFGPFDRAPYDTLEELEGEGLVDDTVAEATWLGYRLAVGGQVQGEELLGNLSLPAQEYIRQVSEFVRRLSFAVLVSAIYGACPEMRANSVFRDSVA